jgi:hypothetical protein
MPALINIIKSPVLSLVLALLLVITYLYKDNQVNAVSAKLESLQREKADAIAQDKLRLEQQDKRIQEAARQGAEAQRKADAAKSMITSKDCNRAKEEAIKALSTI